MPTKTSRRSGQNQDVLATVALALLITGAIVLCQFQLRRIVPDATQLNIFYYLFLIQDYPAALLAVFVLLLGLLGPVQRAGASLARIIGERPTESAVVTGAALAAGAYWIYRAHPLSMDEYAPYLQSRVFAAGELTGRLPIDLLDWLVVPQFQKIFVPVSHATGQVASTYLPGFALLLTPFTAFGVPWLTNPVIGALSVLAIHRLAVSLTHSHSAGGAAVLLSLASPAFTISAISFYSMSAHLLCNAVFVLLLMNPTRRRVLAAGIVGGLALTLHNPVPHALFAAPWLLWLLTLKDRWRLSIAIAAGYIPWMLFGWFGWMQLLADIASPTAFSGSPEPGGVLSKLTQAAQMLVLPHPELWIWRLVGLTKLWVWAVPALVLAAGLGFWRCRGDIRLRLLLASAILTLFGYLFVPFSQGHGWGFRYFHSAWFVLPVLAVAAFTRAGSGGGESPGARTLAVLGYVRGTALCSLIVLNGYFAWQVHGFIGTHLAQLPSADSGEARVLIVDPTSGYYAVDLVQNDPFMRDATVIMLTHGQDEDQRMISRYFPELVLLNRDYRGAVWGIPAR